MNYLHEGQARSDRRSRVSLRLALHMRNHLARLEAHHRHRPDRNVLGRRKEGVDHHAHEGRVEAVLGVEPGDLGVRHRLGYEHHPDRQACDEVPEGPGGVVVQDPRVEWKEALNIVLGLQ